MGHIPYCHADTTSEAGRPRERARTRTQARRRHVELLALASLLSALAGRATVRADAPEVQLQERLTRQRLVTRSERRTAGFWLLGFGLLSTASGGVMIGVGHESSAWVAAGITTASFGAINALLSLGLLDLSHARERSILREGRASPFVQLREAELVAQLESGQFFALNTGLDVFYIATGALLCAIAAVRGGGDRWELGAGSAAIGQGVFLLVFDVINWVAANRRAGAARAL